MSLKIRKRDGRWCVVDVRADGSTETPGCHDTLAAARQQRQAAGANMGKGTTAVTVTKPSAWVHECIRRYRREGLSEEEAAQRCYGAWHKRHPGQSARREVKQIDPATLQRVLQGLVDRVGKWTQESVQYVPESAFGDVDIRCRSCVFFDGTGACALVDGEIATNGVCNLWLGDETAGEKQTALRRMLLITSNGYLDRDAEHVSVKALRRYVESCWQPRGGEEVYVGRNVLLDSHRGPPVGDVVWCDMFGPFLVEIAEERDTWYARKRWDAYEKASGGASQGFRYAHRQRVDGTYRSILKYETTVLPVERASNVVTLSLVLPKEGNT